MTRAHQSSRSIAPMALALILCAGTSGVVNAGPVDVTFRPPEIEPRQICAPRPPAHELTATWSDWDGDFGDRPIPLVRRDLRLLQQEDPQRWFDTITRAHDHLLETHATYGEIDRLTDRIDLLIASGREGDIAEQGLAQELIRQARSARPATKVSAAKLLMDGIGVAEDRDRAALLYRDAAFEGHPGALLEMARLASEGNAPEGWNIDAELAVNMAFGAQLGDADSRVCGRIGQIASHYENGDIVVRDMDLAEDWYRLAASIGGREAAWKVAQFHMRAIDIEKDNDVLMEHLRLAAQGDLPYAMRALAQVYERGALTERDIGRATELYQEAASYGDMTALTRLSDLDQQRVEDGAESLSDRIDLLRRITETETPPGWAFAQLGDAIRQRDGMWGGYDEAMALYRRAMEIEPENILARQRLASMRLRDMATEQDMLDTSSKYRNVIRISGNTKPMQELRDIFLCRAPIAPVVRKSDYWRRMEQFSGDTTVDLEGRDISAIDPAAEPRMIAQIQTQALNGRGRSTANLELIYGDPERLSAFRGIARDVGTQIHTPLAQVDQYQGKFEEALAHMRDGYAVGEPGAGVKLLDMLIEMKGDDENARSEILSLSRELAQNGRGLGIKTIVNLDPEIGEEQAYRQYADAIERNGDFEALRLALPHLEDPDRMDDYLGRIRAVIPCNAQDSIAMIETLDDMGRTDAARAWVDIARAEAAESSWQIIALGDTIRERAIFDDPDARGEALYREAAAMNDPLAMRRILAMRKDGQIDMSTEETADLYVEFIRSSDMQKAVSALKLLGYAADDVRQAVSGRIDPLEIYREAAAAGYPDAQLALAKIVLDDPDAQNALTRYAELIRSSARGGNAEAMRLLSEAYGRGLGVERSLEKSDTWLLRAAEAGNIRAAQTVDLMNRSEAPSQ